METRVNVSRAMRNRWMVCAAAGVAASLMSSQGMAATTYTWSSATSGGTWSTAANWSPSTAVPTTGDTVLLDTASADRTVTYDSGATNNATLASLTLNQGSAFVNMLDVQKSFAVSSNIALGSSAGTSQIFIDPTTPTSSLQTIKLTNAQVTLGAGGVLEFSNFKMSSTQYTSQSTLTGELVINGGTFQSNVGVYSSSSAALTSTISGNLSMSSGTLSFAKHGPDGNALAVYNGGGYVKTTDDRLSIGGNLNITGGTLETGNIANTFYLNGASNSISGLGGALAAGVVLQQAAAGTQSFQSDSAISGGFGLRFNPNNGNVNYQVGSKSGGTLSVGQITFTNKAVGGTETLQLTSDLATNYNPGNSGSSTSPTFVIDTNGHTFDLSGAAAAYSQFNIGSTTTTKWAIANSAGSAAVGTVKARNFDLSLPNGGSTVGAYVNLTATGGGGFTNTLSNINGASTIDPTSTFTYNGTATTSNYDKLVSSRTIGNLAVKTGALQLASNITTGSGSTVSVSAGATLDLGGYTLGSDTVIANGTLGVGSGYSLGSGQTLKGSGAISGNLTVASGGTLSPGNSPGTLSETGNATYAGGGTYQWEINDAAGVAGANPGWDRHAIAGSLDITASSSNPFIIDITSLSATSAGDAANFLKGDNYDWVIAEASGGITGFDASKFQLLNAHFSNDISGSGGDGAFSVQVENGGTTLNLVYSAAVVPEPAAVGVLVLGAVVGPLLRRRRPA